MLAIKSLFWKFFNKNANKPDLKLPYLYLYLFPPNVTYYFMGVTQVWNKSPKKQIITRVFFSLILIKV